MSVSKIKRRGSDVEISYEVTGEGCPLAFMHGLGAGRAQTSSALTSLRDTMLIAPDMLGHGDSVSEDAASGAVMSFNQCADDVIAILDHLGIEMSNIGGLSMGAGVALNIVLRYPERVNKLILLRPSWLCQPRPAHLALVAYVGKWIEEDGVEVAEQKLIFHPDYIALHAEVPKVAESIRGLFRRPAHFSHTAVLYKMWEDAPFSSLEDLSKVSQEALVLYTTRDNLHPFSVAEIIANALPSLHEMQELPPRYDQPEEYTVALNKALNDFHHLEE
ncbi:MAG: pimeloyl-ACP methyl ester carboxylesterase [Cryomorphaceae bacterium]|jgi:pimeloyl-ACP methyl ester carboxylesterase